MKTALLFLFAAETVLYSLLWHNKEARSLERNQPRKPDRKVACPRHSANLRESVERDGILGQLERQIR